MFREIAAAYETLMYQLCKGVAFCHGHVVLHRDLKSHNLLMDRKTLMLKIADLGLSRSYTVPLKKYTHEILTMWYRAPEVLLGATHYSTPVDIWSVGCIFAELVTTQALFAGDSELQQHFHIFRLLGTPNEKIWPGVRKLKTGTRIPSGARRVWPVQFPVWRTTALICFRGCWSMNPPGAVPSLEDNSIDLLSRMLEYEPSKCISAKKAMEHPYFDDLKKTYL